MNKNRLKILNMLKAEFQDRTSSDVFMCNSIEHIRDSMPELSVEAESLLQEIQAGLNYLYTFNHWLRIQLNVEYIDNYTRHQHFAWADENNIYNRAREAWIDKLIADCAQ
jgi:hypothetical protein